MADQCLEDFICIFKYNQQDATLHNFFISVKCSAYFGRFLRPSSGAPKPLPRQWQVAVKVWHSTRCCIYSFWAPNDGRRNRLKHVEHFTEINKLCNVASRWLYLKIRLRCTDPWTSERFMWKVITLSIGSSYLHSRGRWDTEEGNLNYWSSAFKELLNST